MIISHHQCSFCSFQSAVTACQNLKDLLSYARRFSFAGAAALGIRRVPESCLRHSSGRGSHNAAVEHKCTIIQMNRLVYRVASQKLALMSGANSRLNRKNSQSSSCSLETVSLRVGSSEQALYRQSPGLVPVSGHFGNSEAHPLES